MKTGEKIRALRRAAGISQEHLAIEVGVSTNTIGNIERGAGKGPITPDTLYKLATYFKVHPAEIDDTLKRFDSNTSETGTVNIPYANAPVHDLSGETVYLPHYTIMVAAGGGMHVPEPVTNTNLPFRESWVRSVLHTVPQNLFLVDVWGDSMESTLYQGDIVMVDTTLNHLKNDGIYVFREDDMLFVKRIERHSAAR